jgi:hypothetical protein
LQIGFGLEGCPHNRNDFVNLGDRKKDNDSLEEQSAMVLKLHQNKSHCKVKWKIEHYFGHPCLTAIRFHGHEIAGSRVQTQTKKHLFPSINSKWC